MHSRHWLSVRADVQGLAWLWLVPLGSQSQTSWLLERCPSCSINPSGRVTLPKWVLAPRIEVAPMNSGAGSWINGGGLRWVPFIGQIWPLHNNVSDTWATITRLIDEAESSILIATYNIGLSRDSRELFERLAQRLATGSLQEVQLIFHPKQIEHELGSEPLPQISQWFNRQVWPWNPKPLAYVDRRLVERSQDGCYQHAKALIVDAGRPEAKALITSANFSETAQRHNYEAGCLITAPWQVNRISQHFHSLIGQRHFVQLPL